MNNGNLNGSLFHIIKKAILIITTMIWMMVKQFQSEGLTNLPALVLFYRQSIISRTKPSINNYLIRFFHWLGGNFSRIIMVKKKHTV